MSVKRAGVFISFFSIEDKQSLTVKCRRDDGSLFSSSCSLLLQMFRQILTDRDDEIRLEFERERSEDWEHEFDENRQSTRLFEVQPGGKCHDRNETVQIDSSRKWQIIVD